MIIDAIAAGCAECAAAVPGWARFCPSCGAPAVRGTPAEDERKVVTVIFCDLVGSTALSGALDPETVRSITLRYFRAMREKIEAHGGTVEKFIGDAVMAVFGVPVTHEDDARRACAAALDLIAAIDALNIELGAGLGVRLRIRVGVHTGPVVAGRDTSARQALVSGETVNIAARLEQRAAAGQILVSGETVRAAGPAVRTEPVGPLALRGKQSAVTGYRLTALGEDAPEVMRRFDVPFVGRSAELAALDAALADVRAGAGAVLLTVSGEAGLGKTRLLHEWVRRVAGPVRYGAGRCRPYGQQGSLSPLAEAVADLLDGLRRRGRTPSELAEPLAVLAEGLLRDGTPSPSPDDTRSALAGLLTVAGRDAPVVLAVDDCQWAGPLLLDLLDRLVEDLAGAPVLLIRATRPELLDRREVDGSRPRARALALSRLSPSEARRMAAGLNEVGAHHAGIATDVLARAEGNPLHLEQLAAAVCDNGGDTGLPATLQALLAARIDGLDRTERTVIGHAAVIGRTFRAAEVVQLAVATGPAPAQDTAAAVRRSLAGLVRRRLIEPSGRPGDAACAYRFCSGLLQEVAYRALPKHTRADRHERAADLPSVLAAGDAAVGTRLQRAWTYRAELGVLDGRADGLRDRAGDLLLRAGTAAAARSDLPRAAELLTRAGELAGTGAGTGRTARAHRVLGEVQLALGRVEAGRALLRQVLAAPDGPVDAAHAALALAVADPESGPGAIAEVARHSLSVFRTAGDDVGQARAQVRLAQEEQLHGRHRQAAVRLDRALQHAVEGGAEPERALVLGALGVALWRGPEPVGTAVQRCRALLAQHGDPRPTVRVTLNCPLAVLLALQDQVQAARGALAVAAELVDTLRYAEGTVVLPLFGAHVELLAGRPDAAAQLLDRAHRAALALDAGSLLGTVARERARLQADRGEWSAARDALRPAGTGDRLPRADAADLLGLHARLAAEDGDARTALRSAARATAAAAGTESPVVQAVALFDRARVYHRLGAPARAARAASAAGERFLAKGHRPGARATAAWLAAGGLRGPLG